MPVPDNRLIEMYRRMLRIRVFDERAADLLKIGQIPGAIHTSIGHEAAVVGACMAVRTDDYMTGYHRSHGHPIGKGASLGPLMAELFGRATGVCRGKGGSMHLADFSVGSLGESGIVAAGMPIAVGAALSAKMRGEDKVCLCFFGDGAANAGPFHESLNLAAIWNVPAIFVCENNSYAITFPIKEAMAIERIADRAAAYGIPGVVVDGQDVLAVNNVVSEAADRARAGKGPTLIEAQTYRYRDHAEFGGLKVTGYRTEAEVEAWQRRDPITLFRGVLIDRGVIDANEADQIASDVSAEIASAIGFAQDSPMPEAATAYEDLFATPVNHQTEVKAAEVAQLTYLEANSRAIAEEMRRDSTVLFLGQDIRAGLYGGFPVNEFAEERVRSLPISENGFVGASVGAAMTGLRPVVHMGFSTFLYSAMDQVVNQAAKLRYMSGGQARVPLVLVAPVFYSGGIAAHHSDRPFALFANSPGLKVIAPSTPYDMMGLTTAAIRDDDPVVLFVDASLWGTKGAVGSVGDYVVPVGRAEITRSGTDATVVGIAGGVALAQRAAAKLEEEGISLEVVDPRSLVPLDVETIAASVEKTGRLVVVDPAPRTCGFAGEIVAAVAELGVLRAPPARVAGADVPTPFSPVLERTTIPDVDDVTETLRRVVSAATANAAVPVTAGGRA